MRKFVLAEGLLRPGDSVLVACSGGPDSVALLHLLLELSRDIPFSLSVAHFNHQLRPQADADEHFVQTMTLALDLPYFAGRADVRAEANKRGLGIEEAGRCLRYEFLERAAAEAGTGRIATGHHRDDQAETVLMRLLRGTGLTGLAGIPAARGGVIIRPLLDLGRDEILDYLRDRKRTWRTDDSNRDEKFLRNKIRNKLVPYLEKNFAPAVVRSLARLAAISRDEDEFLERAARTTARRAIMRKAGETFLDAEALRKLPPAIARRVVRNFLLSLKGDLRDVSFDDVDAIRDMEDGAELPLSKTLVLERRRSRIGRRKARPPAPRVFALLWDGRGELPVPAAGWKYKGRIDGPTAVRTFLESISAGGGRRTKRIADDAAGCVLDAAKLKFPLLVRNRRPGDRYHPLGAPGRKKLKEVLRAKGVPEGERGVRPVFLSGNEIVWVQGLAASENHKVTARTKKMLMISAAPAGRDAQEKNGHDGEKS
jgi:tRNA(Ile)-lysidine synthase